LWLAIKTLGDRLKQCFYLFFEFNQVQCNVFEGVSGEVALTAGGGRRGLPALPGSFENVAMVLLQVFLEFLCFGGSQESKGH
jgi:hypothetical protein